MPGPSRPPVQSMASAQPSQLLERARAVHAALRALFKARNQNLAQIAHTFAAIKREGLHRYLGYTNVYAYAWDEHRYGRSKVSELIGISEESLTLPKTRAAFDRGELPWTKAREVVKVATPETEAAWLEKSRALTAEALRADRKGEPARARRILSLSLQEAALYDQLLAGARRELGVLPDGDVALQLMLRGASGAQGQAPKLRLVISECSTCGKATAETREGPVSASPSALEVARCDGEVHDLREGTGEVKRTIPAAVWRTVNDRDKGRCQVPGCKAMAALDCHHEGGWREGHDPRHMLMLCRAHHVMRHEGLLRIEGSAPDFRFVLLDGTPLGEPGRTRGVAYETASASASGSAVQPGASQSEAGVAYETASAAAGQPEQSAKPVRPARDPVRDANLALCALGLKPREAKRDLELALADGRDTAWTASDLVAAALRANGGRSLAG